MVERVRVSAVHVLPARDTGVRIARWVGVFAFASMLASSAHAADLASTKAPDATPATPSCFAVSSSTCSPRSRDCPLRYGPFTLYGTLDGGYGYEQWGAPVGASADKPNYAIQRNSGDTHWLWSPNGLSTSTIGVRLSQKIGRRTGKSSAPSKRASIPIRSGLINGPQSQADNNPYTPHTRRTDVRLRPRRAVGQRARLYRHQQSDLRNADLRPHRRCCRNRRSAPTIPWRRSPFRRSAFPRYTPPSAPARPRASTPL